MVRSKLICLAVLLLAVSVFTMQSASLPSYVWILVPAVLVGGWLGAEYGSGRFANPLVRRILAVALALAGAKMILA